MHQGAGSVIENAEGRNRTDMDLRPLDFESSASTSFTTPAGNSKKTKDATALYQRLPVKQAEFLIQLFTDHLSQGNIVRQYQGEVNTK